MVPPKQVRVVFTDHLFVCPEPVAVSPVRVPPATQESMIIELSKSVVTDTFAPPAAALFDIPLSPTGEAVSPPVKEMAPDMMFAVPPVNDTTTLFEPVAGLAR